MPGRGWIMAAVVVLDLAASAGAGRAAGEVTVEGNRFYRDGAPWVAEGVTLVGLVSPEAGGRRSRPTPRRGRRSAPACSTRSGGSAPTSCASRSARPGSTRSRRPTTRPTATTCWRGSPLTRAAGFNVIVSMQWQGAAGPPDPTGLPSATTRRAWREIVPAFAEDRGVLLEIFNEPAIGHSRPEDWKTWAEATQPLIDMLRRAGSKNVLLVGGVAVRAVLRRRAAARRPARPARLRRASLPRASTTRPAPQWERKFGDLAETHPVMATAFNAQAGGGYCRPELPEQTAALLDYLDEKRIGLVAWALDMPNLRKPDGSYTTLDHLVCGQRNDGGRGGAGQMIHEYFLAN